MIWIENLCNVNSRGPDLVQAQSFRAKTVRILSVNDELHRKKKKKKKKTKLEIYALVGFGCTEDFSQLWEYFCKHYTSLWTTATSEIVKNLNLWVNLTSQFLQNVWAAILNRADPYILRATALSDNDVCLMIVWYILHWVSLCHIVVLGSYKLWYVSQLSCVY